AKNESRPDTRDWPKSKPKIPPMIEEIRVVNRPGIPPKKGRQYDYLEAGRSIDDLLFEIHRAPVWRPSALAQNLRNVIFNGWASARYFLRSVRLHLLGLMGILRVILIVRILLEKKNC